ncbi:MAG: glycoside hydrolase family 2 [Oscillospiraceae bacterium]|nr:glycoside hydrolase family 2 [Oscillospiraceae bacterium]
MALAKLTTAHGEARNRTPWQSYPRPQLRRDSYVNLNGEWDFTTHTDAGLPQAYDREILVPFCPESPLSGIETHFPEGTPLFYRRFFTLPEGFNRGRVLLHIGAADQTAEIYVNRKKLFSHTGGYESFSVDITGALETENELVIRCTDDLRDLSQPYGKQTMKRGGMWYTPVSGIWQTVWLESVPENYVNRIDISNTLDSATITVTPALSGKVRCGIKEFPLIDGRATVTVDEPIHWTPETPCLYDFTVFAGEDKVHSYFALRTLETKVVEGIPRLCLNGKPYFFHGLLDQGYWPDGLFTPAAPECFAEDILAMKKLGFNTLRKHIKVEPEQFYYDCDRLGMVVFQDMVNNGDYAYIRDTVRPTFFSQHRRDKNMHRDEKTRKAFLAAMKATVDQLKNHPCICYWTIFNEGWGQFDSDSVYPVLKELDGTRFIDSTSGWFRQSRSDVESLHIYFDMWHRLKKSDKPIVLSEFGGFTYAAPGHIFNPDRSYGYGGCKTAGELSQKLLDIYQSRVIPAVKQGLCGSIYTQLSDVEDEINGIVTYDRRVCKPDPEVMNTIAKALADALNTPVSV